MPALGKVQAGPCADLVTVRLVSGQSPKQFADRAQELAHGFGVLSCRIRTAAPGTAVLELVRRDALAAVIPALPIPATSDLRALLVGRCEDGSTFTIRLHGTHLLIAGATGRGKGSYIWGLVRAMLPAMLAGLAVVHACDPKLMELAFGRPLFERHGTYAADPADIADLLEADVADMQSRAARFAGRQRDHTPTAEFPFVVVLVDEVAFLTAYQADRKLRERILAALATLTTQGRAVGYCVVAALQDPRKEVLNIRNLFPDIIWSPSDLVFHVHHGLVRRCDLPGGRGYLPLVHHVDQVEERCSCNGWRCPPRVESWTVLGDDDIPIEPVERYLAYLTDVERSPNTVRSYATT